MKYDLKSIANEVRRRIVHDGMRPIDAGASVARELAASCDLYALTGFLAWACTEAEREADPIHVLGAGGDHRISDNQNPREPARTKYRSLLDDPLSVVLPIGSLGERKPLRDWTREDLLRYATWCRANAETWGRKGKNAKRVAGKMSEGETVGDAWARLDDDHRKSLLAA